MESRLSVISNTCKAQFADHALNSPASWVAPQRIPILLQANLGSVRTVIQKPFALTLRTSSLLALLMQRPFNLPLSILSPSNIDRLFSIEALNAMSDRIYCQQDRFDRSPKPTLYSMCLRQEPVDFSAQEGKLALELVILSVYD